MLCRLLSKGNTQKTWICELCINSEITTFGRIVKVKHSGNKKMSLILKCKLLMNVKFWLINTHIKKEGRDVFESSAPAIYISFFNQEFLNQYFTSVWYVSFHLES